MVTIKGDEELFSIRQNLFARISSPAASEVSSQAFIGIESAALRAAGGHIPVTAMGPLFRPSTRYLVTRTSSPVSRHRFCSDSGLTT
jgi:hypothetical protein